MPMMPLRNPTWYVTTLSLVMVAAAAPVASAQPTGSTEADPGVPVPVAVAPVQTADPSSPAAVACSQFAAALDASSLYYGYFADAIDGSERPDYADPAVRQANSTGRTALRQAAATALAAARTPGLASAIADPMRAWSLDASKLLLKMGLRGGGTTLDVTALELNADARAAQSACASSGTHA
ncbi:hypothetical protein Mycch_2254 [Mycolicibacterium chubuense NBB4]|uniref:Uncharacterized protein n=1 Tax=Mycolicibacterium chubuense (strain NBB4) TaxID=710421 RepID=I4BIC4_MYCCN|nr:hypothetical protein [Mycolicibacterium chubuense]AFM17031.1 hypothetical protein Mycch_2254 [Mycolicibacterium chubuense NBB4]